MTATVNRRTVAVRTLGCKVNVYESEQILAGLLSTGEWVRPGPGASSDLYVINSCTVTRTADRQTRQEIRRCVRDNPNAWVVVTGCYAQMDPSAVAEVSGVDLVVGNDLKLRIPELLPRLESGRLPRVLTGGEVDGLVGLPDPLLSGFEERTRAFIQVQQGCDQGCTFCIIHKARGASRSLPASAILRQIRRLADAGYGEFVLCGVDLGSYGTDAASEDVDDLVSLLQRILAIGGDFRLRLGSLDPVHITPALVRLMADESRICPHLHVSMQSAHTLILKRMKRRYDRRRLYDAVLGARSWVTDLVVGADVMAGFPTEDDGHFRATLDAIEDLGISFAHVFPYSERPGTPAARIPRQVPRDVRTSRAACLREAADRVLERTLHGWSGRTGAVLLERVDRESRQARGRLENYLPVVMTARGAKRGDWCAVKITGNDGRCLHGEMLE